MIFLNEVDSEELKKVYNRVYESIILDKKRKLNDWIDKHFYDFKPEDGDVSKEKKELKIRLSEEK